MPRIGVQRPGEFRSRIALPVLQVTVAYGFSTERVIPGFSAGFAF